MSSISKFFYLPRIINACQSRHFHNVNYRHSSCKLNNSILNHVKYLQIHQPMRRVYINKEKGKSAFNYFLALAIFIAGMGFAAVPLFDQFCKATNYAGTINIDISRDKTRKLQRINNREITILFNADKSSLLRWNFKPLQDEVKVAPGETVLAFYSAENPTDEPISGISTYNVVPYEAGQYFNKIQCFCFDEQQLNPHEQVDMPVFFYIDPEIVKDPYLQNVGVITLSYTFFEAIEGLDLPFLSEH